MPRTNREEKRRPEKKFQGFSMSMPAAQKEIASIKNGEETGGAGAGAETEADRPPPMAPAPTQSLRTSRTRARRSRYRKKKGDLVAGQPSEGRVGDDSHSSPTAATPAKQLRHSSARKQNRKRATLEAAGNDGNGDENGNENENENTTSGLQATSINVERLRPGAVSVHHEVHSQELGSPQTSNQNNRSQWDNVAEPSDRDEEDPLEANVSMDPLQIVAELAPDEADVEARIAERLERQWNDRLKQEIVEAVTLPNSFDGQDGPNAASMSGAPVDNNFKVCGLRRRQTWGFLLLIVLILVGGGIAGGVIYLQSQGDGDGDGSTNPPSLRPTLPPTDASGSTNPPSLRPTLPPTDASIENMEYLLEQLRDRIAPTNADFAKLEDAATPQFQALAWLANEDQYARDPETVPTTELLERYVLAVLYFSTDGPNWSVESYEFLEPRTACEWNFSKTNGVFFGIYCEPVSDRDFVKYLEMFDLGMTGTIPWELSLLENLNSVDLSNNHLSGPIPSEFGLFTNLSLMWLHGNGLTGQLPNDLPSSMTSLVLDRNLFTGTLPGNWGEGLPDLNLLSLEGNLIQGSLPTELGQLDLLAKFYVDGNLELMGTIPTEFMLMRNLVLFQFQNTSLTGSVNDTLCALSVPPAEMSGDCLGLGFAPEIQCSCCTSCCTQNGETCELMVV